MPRTVAEVEQAMSELRAKGVHHNAKEMRALKDELRMLGAGDAPAPSAETAQQAASDLASGSGGFGKTETKGAGVAIETVSEFEDPDPLDSEEWAFLQKAIAEIDVKFDGQNGHVAMDLYHNVKFKLTIWRMSREIIRDVGVGGEWPQWKALARRDSDGSKIAPKPAPVPAQPPAEIPGGGVKAVTEGGMPMVNTAPPSDEVDAWKKNMARSILGDVSQRPEPKRELQTTAQ